MNPNKYPMFPHSTFTVYLKINFGSFKENFRRQSLDPDQLIVLDNQDFISKKRFTVIFQIRHIPPSLYLLIGHFNDRNFQ